MTQDGYAAERDEHAVALDPADLAVIDRYVRGGGGLLALHTAVICFDADPTWHALVGASWRWGRSSHPPLGPVEVTPTEAGHDHPLTRGIGRFVLEDEAYGFLDEVDDLDPLLVSAHGGRAHPLLWARPVGDGRVVTDLLGHGPASFEDPTHRDVLARAATWARRDAAVDGAPRREEPPMSEPSGRHRHDLRGGARRVPPEAPAPGALRRRRRGDGRRAGQPPRRRAPGPAAAREPPVPPRHPPPLRALALPAHRRGDPGPPRGRAVAPSWSASATS